MLAAMRACVLCIDINGEYVEGYGVYDGEINK